MKLCEALHMDLDRYAGYLRMAGSNTSEQEYLKKRLQFLCADTFRIFGKETTYYTWTKEQPIPECKVEPIISKVISPRKMRIGDIDIDGVFFHRVDRKKGTVFPVSTRRAFKLRRRNIGIYLVRNSDASFDQLPNWAKVELRLRDRRNETRIPTNQEQHETEVDVVVTMNDLAGSCAHNKFTRRTADLYA